MKHEEMKELLALEAAGALRDDERRPLAEHLAACPECARELSELRDAAAALAYTVAPVAPPAHLRSRVLESVRSSPARDAAGGAAAAGVVAERDGASRVAEVRRAERVGFWELLRARPSLAFAATAAVLLVAGLAFSTAVLWAQNGSLRAEVARLSERLDSSQQEEARGRELLAETREANRLLTSPDARIATLAGTKTAPQASARIALDRSTGRALLVAHNLPPAPEGKAYQLWFILDGKPLPGALFKTDADGRALLKDVVPANATDPSAFAVTLEREGGETSPKGDMYLLSHS